MLTSSSANANSDSNRPESFQLKGGLFPLSLLELKTIDLAQIDQELTKKVLQSPGFFKHSGVVLGFEHLTEQEQEAVNLNDLITLCRDLDLLPSAVRGVSNKKGQEAISLGLTVLPKSRGKANSNEADPETTNRECVSEEAETQGSHDEEFLAQKSTEQEAISSGAITPSSDREEAEPTHLRSASTNATKVISTPIRSGQQIYAPGGDLIILSSVSAGAEVLADGNIHIYGSLRGRALAGVQGDESARIFCQSQEAELVSIAGQFLVDEVLRNNHWKQAVQIRLEDQRLVVAPLS